MRAMRAEGFSGYKDLKLADIPKPVVSEGRVLVKVAAAGVTPLEHTILSGGYHERRHHWSSGQKGRVSCSTRMARSSQPGRA